MARFGGWTHNLLLGNFPEFLMLSSVAYRNAAWVTTFNEPCREKEEMQIKD